MMNVDTGLVATVIVFSIVIIMCASFYVAYAYTERFESYLANCAFVENNKRSFSGAGLLGKTMRCSMIYVYLAMPSLGKKRGLVDIKEIESFPGKMKFLLVSLWTAQLFLLIILILFTQFIAPHGSD